MMQTLQANSILQGGKYRIVKTLGHGSFGITYLAVHTALDHKVAIKEFFMKDLNSRGDDGSISGITDGSLSYNYGQKFRKEAHNLARLEHSHIVRVIDSFEENGTFYYAMDYIEGVNLNDYLKQKSLSEKEAVSVITDVADALMYMHEEKHMLHLDLKPGNIMRRSSDGNIILIDFGLSKHFSDSGQPETSTTIGLGTPGYAPIEQSNQAKNGEFRPTIDVYALGATLFKLLTRETPPSASDIVSDDELIERKLREHGISANLVNAVCKAMLPNVRKRTQSVKDFIASLNGVSQPVADDESTHFADNVKNADNSEETMIGYTPEPSKHDVNKSLKKPTFDLESYSIDSELLSNPKVVEEEANNGYKESMFVLAIMYLRGEGKFKNVDKAHGWLVRCRENGDERAAELLNDWESLSARYKGENNPSTSKISAGGKKDAAKPNHSNDTDTTPGDNQTPDEQKRDTGSAGKYNKKIIIGAVAGLACIVILAVILFSRGSSQYGSKPQTEEDSLAYYLGLAQGGGLKQYAVQLGVDSIHFDDFLEGMNEGATGKKGNIQSDEKGRDAYIKGIKVGKQVLQMNMGLASEAFGDSTRTDGVDPLLYGLVEGFRGESKISDEDAMTAFQEKFETFRTKILEEQYGDWKRQNEKYLADNKKKEGVTTLPSGVQYKVLKAGSGSAPSANAKVTVNYEGKLIDGKIFDSSFQHDQAFEVDLAQPTVIPGWIEILKLMPVGAKWEVTIPQEQAYGSQSAGPIKPFSTLIFTMERLK